jgi:hypothetical protein
MSALGRDRLGVSAVVLFVLFGAAPLWALMLRVFKPSVYAVIGLGADAVTGRDKPLASFERQGRRP